MKLFFAGKEHVGDDAFAFRFTPAKPLVWAAGQSIRLELPAGYDMAERRFTIAAAPAEKDVVIVTRISQSDFKQALATLKPGTPVDAYGIEGNFTWHESSQPHLFAASGIGVTPFYAMLRQRHLQGFPLHATLLHASPRPAFALQQHLQNLAAEHPELHIYFLPVTRLDTSLILDHWQSGQRLYLAGSTYHMTELATALLDQNVPSDLLMRDLFTGRSNWDQA